MSLPNLVRFAIVFMVVLIVGGCDDDTPPYGSDGIGAYCSVDYECGTGFCCMSPACGHGTCTYHCAHDADCPYGDRCEGGACFWSCRGNADCAPAQHCTPKGVCQY